MPFLCAHKGHHTLWQQCRTMSGKQQPLTSFCQGSCNPFLSSSFFLVDCQDMRPKNNTKAAHRQAQASLTIKKASKCACVCVWHTLAHTPGNSMLFMSAHKKENFEFLFETSMLKCCCCRLMRQQPPSPKRVDSSHTRYTYIHTLAHTHAHMCLGLWAIKFIKCALK